MEDPDRYNWPLRLWNCTIPHNYLQQSLQ